MTMKNVVNPTFKEEERASRWGAARKALGVGMSMNNAGKTIQVRKWIQK